jgi:APA family basic amino acid/polyamine antiporter
VISVALTWIATEPSWKDTYSRLFTYVVLSGFVFYALSCGAMIRLRYTAADLLRPYRTWGYPVTPIIFILFALWLVINTAREQPADSAVGAALILAGLPIYFLRRQTSDVRHQRFPGC